MRGFIAALSLLVFISCKQRKQVDMLVYNTKVYTVDEAFSVAEAFAVKDGKIVDVGSSGELERRYVAQELLDLDGKFVYPGFIDAHAHFLGFGLGLQSADLTGTTSWPAVIEKMQFFAKQHPEGWLTGRGWDQNDWGIKAFPDNAKLNELFPNRPVLLKRVDGHAAIANQVALSLAGIQPGMQVPGGSVEMKDGRMTGVLIDNAVDLVSSKIPPPTEQEKQNALLEAQQRCFAVGLTTVTDCGVDFEDLVVMDSLHRSGALKMRIYAMLSDAPKNFRYILDKGMIKTDRLNVRAVKVYADGALGSRGAALLEPYADDSAHQHHGFLLSNPEHFDSVARLLYEKELQMCTHAIGDSGNRTILDIYARYLKGKNDRRWRIEHAQVVNEADFDKFGTYDIIPSVQPTHATSDMYWAGRRLGPERVKTAYAYQRLLQQNGWLPLGTDFPVEDISPFKTFYAAVYRKDERGYPKDGFQPEQALKVKEALQGITIWAARASFEEREKGSIEKGKLADFVVLNEDLLKAPPAKVPRMTVYMTYLNGERVH